MLESASEKEPALAGKTVLVVDDDMRNIYALSSVLEMSQMNVVCAQDGKKAIEELASNPVIDLVFMDIMMQKMDGYQALRSEEHTSELQSRLHLVCRLLLEKKKKHMHNPTTAHAPLSLDASVVLLT